MKSLLFLAAAAGQFTATSAFYPYKHTSDSESGQPRRRDAQSRSGEPLLIKAPLRRIPVDKRSNVFQLAHQDSPTDAANSAAVIQDGSDYSYMVELLFGEKKKPMFLLLDSAAVNTWVISSSCTTKSCTTHSTYGTSDSSSLKAVQNTFSISYGTGSVGGSIGTDKVNFLGKSFSMTFGLATTVSEEFQSYPMDGILGVGRLANVANNPTGVKAPTILDILVAEKLISANVFGMRLSRAADGRADGVITFGAPDKSAYTGELNYIPTLRNDRGFWEIPVGSVKFDGKTASIQQSATALLDSGTSFMLLPPADAKAIHAQIPNSSGDGDSFTVPCDTNIPLQITFGGTSYEISPKDYVAKPDGGKCLSNIVARQTFNSNQWLVGDVFLKNVYTVFDADESRIGFGTLSGGSTASSSKTTIPQTSSSNTQARASPTSTSSAQDDKLQASSASVAPKSSITASRPAMLPGTPNATAAASSDTKGTSNGSSMTVSLSRSNWAVIIISITTAHLCTFY